MPVRMIPKYTEVLINLLENDRVKPLIDKSLSTYPIYVSTSEHKYGAPNIIPTRDELNKKILDHYKYREIGFETVGRFLDELEISMNEIMPYYNQLMYSADQDYNIKYNVDYTRDLTIQKEEETEVNSKTNSKGSNTSETTGSDTSETNSETESYTKNVNSHTPQNSLSITNKQIDQVTYADDVTWNHDSDTGSTETTGTTNTVTEGSNVNDSTGESKGEKTGNETHSEHVMGNYGQVSVQALIEHYRKLMVNIEMQIINDKRITELFMNIW